MQVSFTWQNDPTSWLVGVIAETAVSQSLLLNLCHSSITIVATAIILLTIMLLLTSYLVVHMSSKSFLGREYFYLHRAIAAV
jgi:hypothetical protein